MQVSNLAFSSIADRSQEDDQSFYAALLSDAALESMER